MRGHVAKKGNRYYAVVYEGTDPATGKERRRWYQGGATRREAERVLTELVKRMHDGDYRSPERITLGDYLVERWLPVRKTQVGHSTYASYRQTINSHVLPRIGMIPLQRLTPEDLEGFYADLLTEGRLNGGGGGLSPKTVRNIHGMLHKALADACRKGTVQRNVAGLADPPRVRRRSAMTVWDAAQLRQFLAEIEDHPLGTAFHLAAHTGMRRGEVLGLQWSDVDLDAARLSVHQAVTNVAYEKRLGDVKTETGRRMVDLDARTVDVLRAWRKTQIAEHQLTGRRWSEDGFVFARPDGEPIHPDYVSQCFERHLAKSSLPRIRLHDLRHTHATILLKAGVPVKVVSERLGHSSPAFTMTVYQHVLPGMQAEAARVFGEAMFSEKAT
ncbi:tyrosine-type recombinase/integrase [Rhabdothermincola salaria]|uniref:site-specific integrase n=1 Tax=Rhabdothermincola salaria TaxID=2903142 RepID=UPI001E5E1F37|nr:site-specific integrase [Rhabdothermincola salaria]